MTEMAGGYDRALRETSLRTTDEERRLAGVITRGRLAEQRRADGHAGFEDLRAITAGTDAKDRFVKAKGKQYRISGGEVR